MTRLQQLRLDAGLTQRELAEATGVSCPTISRIERGRGYALVTTLGKLARYFDVPPSDLIREALPVVGERVA